MLNLRALQCHISRHPIFAPVSFQLPPGHMLHLQGENGSGKTTLLECLAGHLDHSGTLTLHDRSLQERDCLYIGHDAGLYDALTAEENIALRFGFQSLPIPEQIDTLLRDWRIPTKPISQTLSYGQKKKVSLISLHHQAPIWLLDEPFNGLDTHALALLTSLCQKQLSLGHSIIVSGHQWALSQLQPQQTYRLKEAS